MYTIQYETVSGAHATQSFDSNSRVMLIKHLSRFERPFVAVYEQTNVITKAVRADLARMPLNNLSRAARDFLRDRT